jgi:hypothetical protein
VTSKVKTSLIKNEIKQEYLLRITPQIQQQQQQQQQQLSLLVPSKLG